MPTHSMQRLPGSPGCFICDNNASNPRALRLNIFWDEDSGTVHIPVSPDQTWCGYDNVVHGGLVASVLDEAMAWVIKQHGGEWAFTADYQIRYKRPVAPGAAYTAVAEAGEIGRRKITASARLLDAEGRVVAQASAVFLPARGNARQRTAE